MSSPRLGRAVCAALVMVLLASALVVVTPQGSAAENGLNWLTGWSHREAVIFNTYTGAGTNSQQLIELVGGTGTSVSATIHGIPGMRLYLENLTDASFDEIRFTASDGSTLLHYWIWERDPTNYTADVWVNVTADLSINGEQIYLYWGNPSASDASNGFGVFPLFSDFNDGTGLDITNPQNVSYSNGIMQAGTGEGMEYYEISWIFSQRTYSAPLNLVVRQHVDTPGDFVGFVSNQTAAYNADKRVTFRSASDGWMIESNIGGSGTSDFYSDAAPANKWVVHELRWTSASLKLLLNGVMTSAQTNDTMPTGPMYFAIESNWNGIGYYDYVFAYDPLPDSYAPLLGWGPVQVQEAPALDASFSADPTSGMAGLAVTFTPANRTYDSYSWDFGDGVSSTAMIPGHRYLASGTYNVTLTVNDAINSVSKTSQIVVSPLAWNETVTIKAVTTNLKVSVSYSLSDTSLAGAVESVSWSFGDGSTNQSGATAIHTYVKAGTYAVVCTVTSVAGNTTVATQSVTVKAASSPTTVTDDGDGGSSTTSSGTDTDLLIIGALIVAALVGVVALSSGKRRRRGRRRGW